MNNIKQAPLVISAIITMFAFSTCKKERPQLGTAPTVNDATFIASPSAANSNIIDFALSNTELLASWDFGNGLTGTGSSPSSSYPYAGTYTVTVRIFTQGGSAESSQEVVIAIDDPSLINNPLYTMLSGGPSGPGSKTWHVDSANAGHLGVGPDPISALGNVPEWWAAGANEKPGCGLYDDRYVFHIDGFEFDMECNDDVYVHNTLSADFPGSFMNLGDYTAPYSDQLDETWVITEGADTTLTLSGDSFLGLYSGVNTYKIISLSETEMWLQYKHSCSCSDDGLLHWYLRLIPE